MSIGDNIRKARRSKGVTQQELGQILEMSQQQIAQYESGTRSPKAETLKRIAHALDVPVEALIEPPVQKTNYLAYDTQERIIDNIRKWVSAAICEIDPADYYEVRGTYDVGGDLRDIFDGRTPLSLKRLEEVADMLSIPMAAFIGPVDDEPDPDWAFLEERVQSGTATPEERKRYWEIIQSVASGAGERMSGYKISVLNNMDKLNREGQGKVAEYADVLVRSGKHPASGEAEDVSEDA